MEIDLDITNYDLNDILNLFTIPLNFDEKDLKRAKGIVLRTHPDKSNLPSEYFLFYSKAYKVLYSIWEFRQTTTKNTEYNEEEFIDREKTQTLDKVLKGRDFNKWFNKEFEKQQTKIEDQAGYGNWLRSDEDLEVDVSNKSMNEAREIVNKRKAQIRSNELIEYKEIGEMYSTSSFGTELGTSSDTFSSNMFSNLPYQDLRKAHKETVIGVTEEDYEMREKFSSVEEYKSHRNRQNIVPLSDEQSRQYLKQREKRDQEHSTIRAYELAKQTEKASANNSKFWTNLNLLK